MEKTIVPLGIAGTFAVLVLSIVLGTPSTTTTTINPTPNSEIRVTTSDSEVGASGQTIQVRPAGKSTTSFETEVNGDGGKVKLTQEYEFKPSDIDETLVRAEQLFDDVKSFIGQ